MNRRRTAALLVGLVVLAGLATVGASAQAAPPPDPEEDVIGWEDGVWHNESIDVDQSDGLSDAEREVYVARAMARIEVLRDREFQRRVPVSVISREEFGNRTRGNASANFSAWNNQVWEALFVVGEGEDVQDVLHETTTAQVTGGYFYRSDEIRIVTDDPESVTIGRGTLVHELVHAQQDQYVNLTAQRFGGETQDEQLAADGLVEGEANYLQALYEERCGVEWECVPTPQAGGGGSGDDSDVNLGVFLALFHPYSDGPPYVNELHERGGWEAVDEQYASPPNSTEQIIHHVDEEPAPLAVRNGAEAGWESFPQQGRNGTDTAGEASMFAMLWYQAQLDGVEADTIDPGIVGNDAGPYDTYNYAADPTAGWANDAIRPYRKETANGTAYGYVWATKWDTAADAGEFQAAYLEILDAHDADKLDTRTWVIESGRFADAFRVARNGSRVTIVNAPTPDDLSAVEPSIAPGTPPATETPETATETRESPRPSEGTPAEPTASPGQPGLGAVGALVALVAAALLGAARRGGHT